MHPITDDFTFQHNVNVTMADKMGPDEEKSQFCFLHHYVASVNIKYLMEYATNKKKLRANW